MLSLTKKLVSIYEVRVVNPFVSNQFLHLVVSTPHDEPKSVWIEDRSREPVSTVDKQGEHALTVY